MKRTYAVIWRPDASGVCVGKLGLEDGRVTLEGLDTSGTSAHVDVPREDVVAVDAAPRHGRLHGRQTAEVTLRSHARIALASLDGPGTWAELVGVLASGVASRDREATG